MAIFDRNRPPFPKPLLRRLALVVLPALAAAQLPPLAAPARADGLAGPYLAATIANFSNDYENAATYYIRALQKDPDNLGLMQNALLASVARGDMATGLALARRMEAAGADSQLSQLILLADAIRREDFATALRIFERGGGFSPMLDGLMEGWIRLGLGRMTEALAAFDRMGQTGAMAVFATYHKALALAVAGDYESAEALFAGRDGQPLRLGRISLIAHIQLLSQLERGDAALKVLNDALNDSGDVQLLQMRARLERGETLPFDVVTTATEGAAEALRTLADVLSGERGERFGLIYGRLAEYLRPDFVEAIILVGQILQQQDQNALAIASFDRVPGDHPLFYKAETARADALLAMGKADAAIAALRTLAKTHPDIPAVHTALGDALRRESRFAEAAKAYEAAIALLPEPRPNHWFLYYARGITYERTGRWDEAERDFRFALELSPDQPLVLNYLGYGLVEKRIKLDEALEMIRTAVAKRPGDGYITDSLGWVFYRLGRYEEAVPHLERAVELEPVDPIINDHLGDAYWMVGRRLEARFQWKRALSFDPEEKDAERIRLKLELGLDEVLRREEQQDTARRAGGD